VRDKVGMVAMRHIEKLPPTQSTPVPNCSLEPRVWHPHLIKIALLNIDMPKIAVRLLKIGKMKNEGNYYEITAKYSSPKNRHC
jgi:hypothetical protein